jgi:hypothetical protein
LFAECVKRAHGFVVCSAGVLSRSALPKGCQGWLLLNPLRSSSRKRGTSSYGEEC